MHPLSYLKKTYFLTRAARPRVLSISGAGHQDRELISCGPFLAEVVEEEVVDTVDRLSQADRLPQAGMLGMLGMQEQEPVGLPVLGVQGEGFLPFLPPENIRIHSKLYR
jgi:hypothetical protein